MGGVSPLLGLEPVLFTERVHRLTVYTLFEGTSRLTSLLTELGMSWAVVVATGCMEIPSIVQARIAATRESDVPVLDLEIPLNNSTEAENATPGWVDSHGSHFDLREIAGCSVEGNHLTRAFDIWESDGAEIWSGCCGIGLNRLVVGFLFQNGFDERLWPALMRDR